MEKKRPRQIRSIQKSNNDSQNTTYQFQEFPKDEPGAIYVRQSTIAQVQKNLHSYEMQTSEFVAHFREKLGVTGHIEIIADDEGKSGTLDIHDREGLLRVTRLIEGKELLNGKRLRWIGAVHVNRLTRDPWLIVPGVLMKDCYQHDVWISTLRMNFNFKDEYCQRVFMLEAEESARHLKWMKEVLGGGRWAASDRGIYDARWVMPGYIVDYREYLEDEIKNPTHKKYIVYEPHAEVVRWLFKRYLELDGNFPALCREVEAMPYLFPAFEKRVDRKNISKFSGAKTMIKDGPYRGCYRPTDYGLFGILTNPVYLGWWIPAGGGIIENNHEPIIEETLFTYAHKRLSSYDFNGNRQKPKRVIRNGQEKALLKKVIEASGRKQCIYTKEGFYTCRTGTGWRNHHEFSVLISTIDSAFVQCILERLKEWEESGELVQWKEKVENRLSERDEQKKQIRKSINEAVARMKRINDVITDIDNPPSKSQENDLKQMYKELEVKKLQLEQDLKIGAEDEDEEAVNLYQIWELIPEIKKHWEDLPFEERMRVVTAFTRRAILDVPSPGWLKLDVEWKIGQRDVMFLRRGSYSGAWTEEEDAIIRECYPNEDGAEILKRLPRRTWGAIMMRAAKLGIERTKWKRSSICMTNFYYAAWEDKLYADEHDLDINDKNPQWLISTKVPFYGTSVWMGRMQKISIENAWSMHTRQNLVRSSFIVKTSSGAPSSLRLMPMRPLKMAEP